MPEPVGVIKLRRVQWPGGPLGDGPGDQFGLRGILRWRRRAILGALGHPGNQLLAIEHPREPLIAAPHLVATAGIIGQLIAAAGKPGFRVREVHTSSIASCIGWLASADMMGESDTGACVKGMLARETPY